MIIKNQPNKIYLNYGDIEYEDEDLDHYEAVNIDGAVTWCQDRIFDTDVAYVKCETVANMLDEIDSWANGMIASGNHECVSYALKIKDSFFKAITAMEGSL